MSANVGTIDRILRIVVGIVLLLMTPQIAQITGSPIISPGTPWGWIGLVPLLTGLFSFCPVYTALGVSTCKRA